MVGPELAEQIRVLIGVNLIRRLLLSFACLVGVSLVLEQLQDVVLADLHEALHVVVVALSIAGQRCRTGRTGTNGDGSVASVLLSESTCVGDGGSGHRCLRLDSGVALDVCLGSG
jgi:hypothetical protein